jgi:hypothetical protein
MMTKAKQNYFAPCGINHLITDSFYEADGTWKPVGGWPKTIFQKHSYMSPGYKKIGPANSQGYYEGGAFGGDYKMVWLNEMADGNLQVINKNTEWECGKPDNQAIMDNTVPNCGWWTNVYGENKRQGANNADKYFKYEMRTGSADLNMLYNMGHGSGIEDETTGNAIGTQPRSRESNVIGIDTWIHAEKQSGGLVGSNTNETRLGVTNIFGMYCAAMDAGRIAALKEFIECLLDPNCDLDLDLFPFEGRSQCIGSIVAIMGSKGNFEFSQEYQELFARGEYNNDMMREIKSQIQGRSYTATLIKILQWISNIITIINILDPDWDGIGPGIWLGDIDFLISYDIPTPVNELKFYRKGLGETVNRDAEYWGHSLNDPNWGYKRVSFTCDIELHALMDVLGATWNGYLWNFSHTKGATRVRLLRVANAFPIRTVQTAMEPDDPRQDKYMAAIHAWNEKDPQFDDRRWNRTSMKVMNEDNGIASEDAG